MNDPTHYSLEKMIGRLYSALTTSDMLRCGVHPTQINFEADGQIKIQLKQELDENGKPKPITIYDDDDDETAESSVELSPPEVPEQKPNPIFDVLMKKKKPVIKRNVTRAKQTT